MRWLALFATLVLTACANVLLKLAAKPGAEDGAVGVYLLLRPQFIVGGSLLGVALLCYAYTLKHLDLGIAYPIMTGGALTLISIASVVILGEPLTLLRTLGAILVICGVAILVNC